jgi:hypothetical protein
LLPEEEEIQLNENFNSRKMLTWMQPIKQNPLSDFAVTDQSLHIDKYMDPEYGVTITNHDD